MPKMMDIKEFSKELERRTRRFAVSIIQLSSTLPNIPEGRVIRNMMNVVNCLPFFLRLEKSKSIEVFEI